MTIKKSDPWFRGTRESLFTLWKKAEAMAVFDVVVNDKDEIEKMRPEGARGRKYRTQ